MNILSVRSSVRLLLAAAALLPLAASGSGPADLFSDLDGFEPDLAAPPAPVLPAVVLPPAAAAPETPGPIPPDEPEPVPDEFYPVSDPVPAAPSLPFPQPLPPSADQPPAVMSVPEQEIPPFFATEPAVTARTYEPPPAAGSSLDADIADKKTAAETQHYKTTRARMLETVQSAWNTPSAGSQAPEPSAGVRGLTENEKLAAALLDKLAGLRIPAIAFHDADIQQVVLELSALCRKLDPERKGVNMVVFGTSGTAVPLITFSGTDLSVLETLDIITQMSGMKYEAGPGIISLTPVHYEPPQQMVSAEFDMIPSVGRKITEHLESIRETGGQTPGRSGPCDVRGVFSTVPFPPGSSAQFSPEFNVLLVHNVPKYIDKIAALLDHYTRKALEERSRQVEIETKFIEVSQGALEELGFNWTLGTPGQNISTDTWTLPGGQQLFTDSLRSGREAFGRTAEDPAGRATGFSTFTAAVTDPVGSGLIDTASELLVRKVKGDLKADLLIRALERTAGSDLLSAPRIVARSGETASIHVGEVRWFPTSFNVKIERDTQPALVPEFYEEERTGVLMEVTPELDPENGTIHLALSPELRELAGFDEQHVGTIWPTFGKEDVTLYRDAPSAVGSYSDKVINFLTAREQNRTIHADRLIARRPVFKSRKVTTAVTIEDGSTIAMGGLIKEQLETFKDSVPFLGTIPLLGRLFRSEGERSVKRNLLIFVTANQVTAGGGKKTGR